MQQSDVSILLNIRFHSLFLLYVVKVLTVCVHVCFHMYLSYILAGMCVLWGKGNYKSLYLRLQISRSKMAANFTQLSILNGLARFLQVFFLYRQLSDIDRYLCEKQRVAKQNLNILLQNNLRYRPKLEDFFVNQVPYVTQEIRRQYLMNALLLEF